MLLIYLILKILMDPWLPSYAGPATVFYIAFIYDIYIVTYIVDIVKVDALAQQKISKCHFFRGIENSFREVTHTIGLEPRQYFSFQNISTNTVARGLKSFGGNGLWLTGCLSFGQNFFVQFAQSHDEQIVKI